MADADAGEVLLSVPLTRVFSSEPESELHWAAEMAVRLLHARHAAALEQQRQQGQGQQAAAAHMRRGPHDDAQGGAHVGVPQPTRGAQWSPWIAALPAHVRTPLEYDNAEIRQLGCSYMAEEIETMQECMEACYEEVRGELEAIGSGWADFLWAVQVFTSRCFFEPTSGRHMCVPGVDMANHSLAPSATVRIQHSPAACQGYDALSEVAEVPPPEPSRFLLLAGDQGIRAGDEVTISYGPWPNEPFLLLFGFVPGPANPHDSLLLFRDAHEAAAWCLSRMGAGSGGGDGAGEQPFEGDAGDGALEAQLEAVLAALESGPVPPGDSANLVVTQEGVDARLVPLLRHILEAAAGVLQGVGRRPVGREGPEVQVRAAGLLRARLEERAREFAGEGLVGGVDEAKVWFVGSKRRIAEEALSRMR